MREFTGPGEFPTQRAMTRSFDAFFNLRLNKRLSKQPWGWWFEMLSRPLWRQCNDQLCFWSLTKVMYFSLGNHLCDICGMSFTSAMGIRDHRAMHHGTPRYVCALCGKGYMSRTLYRSHVLGHTKVKIGTEYEQSYYSCPSIIWKFARKYPL